MKERAIKICLAFALLLSLIIPSAMPGDIFYDAGGRRIGTAKLSGEKKNYYGAGGQLLGWSKRSGGKYRYYDMDGKLLGYSQKEDGEIYFYGK